MSPRIPSSSQRSSIPATASSRYKTQEDNDLPRVTQPVAECANVRHLEGKSDVGKERH